MKKRKAGRPKREGEIELLNLRMYEIEVKRLNRLTARMNKLPGVDLSRSACARRALVMGLALLEEDPGRFFGGGE